MKLCTKSLRGSSKFTVVSLNYRQEIATLLRSKRVESELSLPFLAPPNLTGSDSCHESS